MSSAYLAEAGIGDLYVYCLFHSDADIFHEYFQRNSQKVTTLVSTQRESFADIGSDSFVSASPPFHPWLLSIDLASSR